MNDPWVTQGKTIPGSGCVISLVMNRISRFPFGSRTFPCRSHRGRSGRGNVPALTMSERRQLPTLPLPFPPWRERHGKRASVDDVSELTTLNRGTYQSSERCVVSNARAGWLGTVSYDSDKESHPRGPRKDAAQARCGVKTALPARSRLFGQVVISAENARRGSRVCPTAPPGAHEVVAIARRARRCRGRLAQWPRRRGFKS